LAAVFNGMLLKWEMLLHNNECRTNAALQKRWAFQQSVLSLLGWVTHGEKDMRCCKKEGVGVAVMRWTMGD